MILFALVSARYGFPPYRDQHLGTALIYAQEGIDLLHPRIVGFNANQVPTILEFPWWQAGAGWTLRLSRGWWGGANVFSLIAFIPALFPVYQMGRRCVGRAGAGWVVAAFLAQPLVFEYAGTASPDGMSLASALWAYDRTRAFALKGGWNRGLAAVVLAALTATLKMPFFMAAGLAVAILFLTENWRQAIGWVRLGLVAAVSAAVFFLWTRYTDQWFEQALWPLVDLRVRHNPDMVFWYFGDWAYRLSPGIWGKAAWRAGTALLGSVALVGIVFWGWVRHGSREARAWLLGAGLTTLIFSHLVLHHWHYYLMFSPAVALGMGVGVASILDSFAKGGAMARQVGACGVMLVWLAALFQGLVDKRIALQFDPYPEQIAKKIKEQTNSSDRLLIAGGGWGGDILFRAQRDGLSIWNTQFLENARNAEKARSMGFGKLVIVRESPLLAALRKTNPGGGDYSADPYAHYLSPVADSFPLIYQDEQLMIRDIPPP